MVFFRSRLSTLHLFPLLGSQGRPSKFNPVEKKLTPFSRKCISEKVGEKRLLLGSTQNLIYKIICTYHQERQGH